MSEPVKKLEEALARFRQAIEVTVKVGEEIRKEKESGAKTL